MTGTRLLPARPNREAVVHAVALAAACTFTFWLATQLLSQVSSVTRSDDLLGGMWAVASTVFIYRDTQAQDVQAAVSRIIATLVSFGLCLAYLLLLPFHPLGLGVLIGAGAVILIALGRPGDVVTAGITTTVVMVVADMSPEHAWEQPILRLIDTFIGAVVALAAGWLGALVVRRTSGLRAASFPGPDLCGAAASQPEAAHGDRGADGQQRGQHHAQHHEGRQ